MSIAVTPIITVDEYLESELQAEVKHEYLGATVYSRAGASEAHNVIAMNLYAALGTQLRGKPCQPFGSDMKLRINLFGDFDFYYPDAMIACDSTDGVGHGWRERPTVLFEIISEETRRIDQREKRLAYLQIASLEAYIRIEQARAEVLAEVRAGAAWKTTRLSGPDAKLELTTLGIDLPLAELYERVRL